MKLYFSTLLEIKETCSEDLFNEAVEKIRKTSESLYPLESISISLDSKGQLDYSFSFAKAKHNFYKFEDFLGDPFKNEFTITREIESYEDIPHKLKKIEYDDLFKWSSTHTIKAQMFKRPNSEYWNINRIEFTLINKG